MVTLQVIATENERWLTNKEITACAEREYKPSLTKSVKK